MNFDQYRNLLLKRIPTAKIASGGRAINCRCMYCPDSRNPQSKHFYISIPQDDRTPSLYYCHLCHNKGVVTYEKLIEWDIFDEEVAIDLIEHNKKCFSYATNNKYFVKTKAILFYKYIKDSDISRIKLNYICDRLGCSFTYEELIRLKIVLNLKDLLEQNYVNTYTRDPQVIDQLDINFLGFISIDNAFLNMRRICDEGLVYKSIDKRYINYKIIDKFDTSERFYTIPSRIDINKPERVKIHIAEGPFDILSIYKNVRKEEEGIYTSVGGSNYLGIVMYFLMKYKLSYCEIHIYPDNDKYGSKKYMDRIIQYLKPLNIPLYIHRNMFAGQKDFGVRLDLIDESIERCC